MRARIRTLSLIALLTVMGAGSVWAGRGDIAIYRKDSGTDAITTSNFDHTWDTTVHEDVAAYNLNVDDTQIEAAAGHHLVLYSARFDSTSGSNRSEMQTQIRVNGSDIPAGWSQCYIRRQNGNDECLVSGGAIIEVESNDDPIVLRTFRTDANASSGIALQPDATGIQLIQLDSDWDYLRLSKTTSQTGPNSATWVNVTYDRQDEIDTDTFAHTPESADITLKTIGHYLVFANTYGATPTGDTDRTLVRQKLTLDGSDIDGTTTTVYIRGDLNSNEAHEGAVSLGSLIETTSANQVLNVELNRGDGTVSYIINTTEGGAYVDRTAITIVKLPDEGDYIRLDDSGTDNLNNSSLSVLGWNTEDEKDSGGFVHSTVTNDSRIEVAEDGDYLFFTSLYAASAGVARGFWNNGWRLNGGSLIEYGQGGNYNRNSGANDTGNWSGLLAPGLTSGDYIEVVSQQLGASGAMGADIKGVQGVRLASIFLQNLTVSSEGTQTANVGEGDTDADMVAAFTLISGTTSATLTSITISETGTVDAQNDLNNVELYADEEGTCSRAGASKIGTTQSFNGSEEVTFSGLSLTVSAVTQQCLFLEFDVASDAGSGATIDFEISSDADVTSTGAVPFGTFPVQLSGTTIIESNDVTVATQLTQPVEVSQGVSDILMGAFTFLGVDQSLTITSITVSETGTLNANSHLSNVQLYADAESTCSFAGASTIGSSTSFNGSEEATFGSLTLNVSPSSQQCVFVELDTAGGATLGNTIELEITVAGDVTVTNGEAAGSFAVQISGTTTVSSNAKPTNPALTETPAFANLETSDTTPELGNWSSTDVDGDNIQYEIQWDTDYAFGSPTTQNSSGHATNGFTAATFASGASVSYVIQAGESLSNGLTYWWRVRARDPSGTNTWSDYSDPRSLTIDTGLTQNKWRQTTGDQFGTGTLTDTETTAGGVQVLGW